jgi:hypothetical protein
MNKHLQATSSTLVQKKSIHVKMVEKLRLKGATAEGKPCGHEGQKQTFVHFYYHRTTKAFYSQEHMESMGHKSKTVHEHNVI